MEIILVSRDFRKIIINNSVITVASCLVHTYMPFTDSTGNMEKFKLMQKGFQTADILWYYLNSEQLLGIV